MMSNRFGMVDVTPEGDRPWLKHSQRREPNWRPLLNTVPYHLPERKFIDVRKFSNK
jgi:hypothetical protein